MTWDQRPTTTPDMRGDDAVAIERYRYLLRTAPPEQLEQAHAEAFAQLSPEQRRQVLETFSRELHPSETARADQSPESLARVATRAEMRQPGTMERLFGGRDEGRGGGGGGWFGGGDDRRGGGGAGLFGGSFFSMLAGAFVGTSIANMLFGSYGYPAGDPAADAQPAADTTDGDAAGEAGDGSAYGGSWDDGSTADTGDGGDTGEFGGDFGDMGGFDMGGDIGF